ncbi:C-type lectin domain family 2 member B-like [Numenius arquata]|uniref:C-type lectin domain family 2 member B-like n=1 Tax=Numenius arquata TaxID=31919 RepID=UPI003D3082E6
MLGPSVGQGAMGERNGFRFSDGSVEVPLSPPEGGVSPHPEVPGAAGRRTPIRFPGKWHRLHPVWFLVLVALVLALTAAVAVLSAGRHGGDPAVPAAPVLACPYDWVGYRNVCYYLSRDQGSWEWSQEQCSSRGASLAVLRREWEMEFLLRLKGNIDYWIGLRRQGERLEWVDGSSFNQTIPVVGEEPCLFLNDHDLLSARCLQTRPYLCSKPMLQ